MARAPLFTPNTWLRRVISPLLALPLTGGAATFTSNTSLIKTTSLLVALGWTRTEILALFPDMSFVAIELSVNSGNKLNYS